MRVYFALTSSWLPLFTEGTTAISKLKAKRQSATEPDNNILYELYFKLQSNRSGLYVNNVAIRWNCSLTAAQTQPDRSSLYINNGDALNSTITGTEITDLQL